MNRIAFVVFLFASTAVFAQAVSAPKPEMAPTPPPPPKIEMVTLPAVTIANMMKVIDAISVLHPEMITSVAQQSFGMLTACMNDNPVNGILRRQGPDQCQPVTDALAEREADKAKAVADAVAAQKVADEKGKDKAVETPRLDTP